MAIPPCLRYRDSIYIGFNPLLVQAAVEIPELNRTPIEVALKI